VLAASVTAQPPASVMNPIEKLWWANFKIGNLAVFPGSWNWGMRFRLPGLRSLVPLLLLWLLAAAVWVVMPWLSTYLRRRRARPAATDTLALPAASAPPAPDPNYRPWRSDLE
jgi:hypothetical protein